MRLNKTKTNRKAAKPWDLIGPIISYKNLLLAVLKKKKEILSRYVYTAYLNEYDFYEIETFWSERECENCLVDMKRKSDATFCPWCIKNGSQGQNSGSSNCLNCTYAHRHGRCKGYGSDYSAIRRELLAKGLDSIVEIPEMEDLAKAKNAVLNNLKKMIDLCFLNGSHYPI